MRIVCVLLDLYLLVLVARAICSFFPVTPGTTFARIVDVLATLTEPVIAPVRRVIPPLGIFDMSFLVVFIVLQVIRSFVCVAGLF